MIVCDRNGVVYDMMGSTAGLHEAEAVKSQIKVWTGLGHMEE
jgi:hypothetical protein